MNKVLGVAIPRYVNSVLKQGHTRKTDTTRGRPYMTSDGRGKWGSAKSDFISKVVLIKHLMRGEGGSKNGKNHLTSYMDGPLDVWILFFVLDN